MAREEGVVAVGTEVEARPSNADELFFVGVVAAYDDVKGTYSVLYEDGSLERGLLRSSLIAPSQRTLVAQDDVVRVEDGHVWLKGRQRDARLLSFVTTPHICQSAVCFSQEKSVVLAPRDSTDNVNTGVSVTTERGGGVQEVPVSLDWETLAFAVDQAIIIALALYKGLNPEDSLKRVCVLGEGAGSVSMCIRSVVPICAIDVVEFSPTVARIASQYFNVPVEDPLHRVHIEDGLQYIADAADESFDIVFVDVATFEEEEEEEEGVDGVTRENHLDLPPPAFVEASFLQDQLCRCIRPHGWAAVNILGERVALLGALATMEESFGSVFVCAVDPNYVMFGSKAAVEASASQVCSWIIEGGMEDLTDQVLPDIRDTDDYRAKSVGLGWFSAQEFRELLTCEASCI
mmetsp:Transcript_21027/g.37251  ORF Transcript_21027/g.37251 Transcript_21027/m.37251 type:complete len:404 (+) Transcript_21027:52-1263(+)|eukprot:CAMPEP_0184548966 /NCGR_PEP_ID=MMETSP0199_2-20130426/6525_1 /TAXON_ID=1112570 /ORGANISM="Thraustochytrium sp., Strain LLF1b" /LENGTH=403 /DNA_ID=CAMNT_0026943645 /DNA_START=8 /DNA_END=1219 /DNA_ORIENTATION=+